MKIVGGMYYKTCELCCGNGCEWCDHRGDYNKSFPITVEVEGKTFTTMVVDADGERRYLPSETGFSRDLIVEVTGECWRWALAPEYSSWAPLEDGAQEPPPPQGRQIKILAYLPKAGETSEQAEQRLRKIFCA